MMTMMTMLSGSACEHTTCTPHPARPAEATAQGVPRALSLIGRCLRRSIHSTTIGQSLLGKTNLECSAAIAAAACAESTYVIKPQP